ncbi:MAG TPA: phosphoribosyltransferase family protein [Saprospiraceae bacterium]|nr:phosphoribosyltransferase family protein [Saprospiraceae bacterium]
MKLLNASQIRQKIRRLAIEILENNYEEEEIILAGINNKGYEFAHLIQEEILSSGYPLKPIVCRLLLNPAVPDQSPATLSIPLSNLAGKAVVVIDDVANTGRTLFYSFQPLMGILPKKVEVAVLVDRKHKLFPVKVDYKGMTLATTLKDHIDVRIINVKEKEVHLV